MKIVVLGGDRRSIKLAELLKYDGYNVQVFGFDRSEVNSLKFSENLYYAIENAKIIIGPLPCSEDNILLNTPLYSENIKIDEVFEYMTDEQIFIAGKISDEVLKKAKANNILTIDLFNREEMTVLNSIPTAEGAIEIAMKEMDITLHDSKAMILGFGRIGKILAKMLQGIGAKVYVEARNYADLGWIHSYGYNPVHLDKMKDLIGEMDVVFNTIPSMILTEEVLLELNKDALVVDLASKPGGVDFEKAKDLGIKTIWALGLPGKTAPTTAAGILKNTIYNIIEELGV
ncbi:dipicolinate synthase subunit DpsA [Tissierella pigra]|uniref:Dipicolinate synthase subunit DpsA n=1 Tax=Tissierella pigra TaxID=2607614 RepID=A0A6N7XR49_9FIRM|nr:dipicolinate synthase subunit DpsA [Tissierella pigra]MBU5426036.1 dipicolinate synthase subunit DpsA [Tissierella pigra]MSU03312.1 dipicolinate synthase subunit DpsA [Tissierella pigra]